MHRWPSYRLQAALLGVLVAGAARAPATSPVDPTQFTWHQRPGSLVPMQTPFTDEHGKPVSLAGLAGRSPIILDLGYYHCPSLCGVVRADLLNALQQSGLVPGQDYGLVSISIDPAETHKDAEDARQSDASEFPSLQGATFHYLTGRPAAIAAIEQAVGFRAAYDPRFRQFLHPSGLVFLTHAGRISSYVLGVGYAPGDVRAAVVRARSGGIARAALPILLLCFHFDSTTGRYTLAIIKVLRLMALVTVGMIVGLVVVLSRRGGKGKESVLF